MLFLYKVPLSPLVLWFPFIVLVQFVMSLAFALFLASATVFVRDVQGIVPFLLRTLLFVSPILYNLEDVPKEMQGLYMFNPLTSVVTSYKYVLLYQRPPLLGPLLIVLAVSLLLIAGGVLLTVRLDKIYARWL
jgi:ABC-type polysaccharide/polyol phosphate export permease